MNQIKGLMDLAWKRCYHDIFAVIHYWMGAMIGLAAVFVFASANLAFNLEPFYGPLSVLPSVEYTKEMILVAAIGFGVINTFTTLTFIAIVVCLFEYTLSFCTVAYYYDNKSWVTVNTVKRACEAFWEYAANNQKKNRELDKEFEKSLSEDITKIKQGE